MKNGNKSKEYKKITLDNFTPLAKNPALAKVLRITGYAEELGSGVRNMYRYAKTYGGNDPKIMDEKVFTTTIELNDLKNIIDEEIKQVKVEGRVVKVITDKKS